MGIIPAELLCVEIPFNVNLISSWLYVTFIPSYTKHEISVARLCVFYPRDFLLTFKRHREYRDTSFYFILFYFTRNQCNM